MCLKFKLKVKAMDYGRVLYFYELFVPGAGAVGYLSENINTYIGLANGVKIKYHSLSFETSEEDEVFNEDEL